ncbi:unnamed protein product [Coregonus sp. 'balchen']|nr:unnamed protein product [Coregonus sp. 'balchen']
MGPQLLSRLLMPPHPEQADGPQEVLPILKLHHPTHYVMGHPQGQGAIVGQSPGQGGVNMGIQATAPIDVELEPLGVDGPGEADVVPAFQRQVLWYGPLMPKQPCHQEPSSACQPQLYLSLARRLNRAQPLERASQPGPDQGEPEKASRYVGSSSPDCRTMEGLSMEASVSAALLMASCLLALSQPSCDQTQGEGSRCVVCPEGQFSAETGLAPCWQCTRCILLNRQERAVCSPTNNAQCGNCLQGYYKLRSRSGEVDLSCMPCYSPTGNVRKECLPLQSKHTSTAVTAASIFLLLLLLWALLLIIERFKQVPKYCPEGLHSEADTAFPRNTLLSYTTETGEIPPVPPSESPGPTQDAHHRCLSSLSHEGEVHPTSIVINVTTNIKPSPQHRGEDSPWEDQRGLCHTPEEMEQKLLEICTVAQGQSLEELNYDTVQDLSLLLDSGGRGQGQRGEKAGLFPGCPS